MAEQAPGAWITLDQARHPGVVVHVEVVRDRVTITGVRIMKPGGVTLDDLRSIPIPRLEAAWNDPASREGKWARSKVRRAGQLARMGAAGDELAARKADTMPKAPTSRRVKIPKERRYPDTFYAQVAELYRALVANGERPAPAIAEANGVPVTTVHAWVKEARARGILAPARKGGATG